MDANSFSLKYLINVPALVIWRYVCEGLLQKLYQAIFWSLLGGRFCAELDLNWTGLMIMERNDVVYIYQKEHANFLYVQWEMQSINGVSSRGTVYKAFPKYPPLHEYPSCLNCYKEIS